MSSLVVDRDWQASSTRSLRPSPALLHTWAQATWFHLLLLGLVSLLFFFHGLAAGELYRTESLRAIIAAEFLRTGDWIVPRLYGEPLFTKPPGMYAAIALMSLPFGEVTETTARLPSALAATSIVFLMYWYFRRQLGAVAGLLAALTMPLSLMWLDKAPSAEIDMVQVAWVTAALLCFFRAVEEEEGESPSRAGTWWLLALAAVAGGLLTKWTAPAFFYGTVCTLLLWRGRLRLLIGRRHLLAAGLAASVCLAWMVAAVLSTGWPVFEETVSREALMRLSPSHHPRPYPWHESLAHPFILWGANLPCSALALLVFCPGFVVPGGARGRWLAQALYCWLWPNLLFWSVIPEHAPRHSFPLAPAIAGLAALVLISWQDGAWNPGPWLRRIRPVPLLILLVAGWLIAKAAFVHAVVPVRNHQREPRQKALQISQAVPPAATLYLFKLKDEGIMFYYGRPVRRLAGPHDLPSSPEPLYCILEKDEWLQWPGLRPAEALLQLRDEQQAPMVLVKVHP